MLPSPQQPRALRCGSPRALAIAALALFTWACQDTTAPTMDPADGTAPRLGQASRYYCSTRTATPSGVRDGWIPLSFPPEARSADSSVMEYRYRRQTPAGVVTYTADCVIPRTISALESMNQRFRVPPELRAPKGRDRDGGEFTTQECVTDGGCTLEPIVVVVREPECDPAWDVTCESSGDGTTNPPPATDPPPSGGGDTGTSPTDADDGTADGTGDCPTCGPHETVHAEKYESALQKIDQAKCPDLYAKAAEYKSTFEIWKETRTHPITGATLLGEWLNYGALMGTPRKPTTAGFWETHVLQGTQFPITVAHEAAHGLGKSDSGNEAESYARSCMK